MRKTVIENDNLAFVKPRAILAIHLYADISLRDIHADMTDKCVRIAVRVGLKVGLRAEP